MNKSNDEKSGKPPSNQTMMTEREAMDRIRNLAQRLSNQDSTKKEEPSDGRVIVDPYPGSIIQEIKNIESEEEFEPTEDYYETKVCTGDWLGGLSIDILEYSEIGSLTEEQKEKLWNEYTDISLLKACEDCFMVKTGEIDQVPGQSTEFFSFMTDDEESLKSELRSRISKFI